MSRLRHEKHHKRASGGKVVAYSGGASNVMKEAHERKRGGRIEHEGEGEEAKHHAGKRARGGRMHHKHEERKRGGHVMHEEHEHHKRARGGAIGSDKRPLSSAAITKKLSEEKSGGMGAGPANEQTDH